MPPHQQHVLVGETIALQCVSITEHIKRVYVPNLPKYRKYYDTIPGTCVVVFSMVDTATYEGDELVIRPLRSGALEAIEDMAASLAFVITTVVILPPSAEAIGFEGPGARQWDANVDALCRRLKYRSITFVQPHPWGKIEYDDEKRGLATSHNIQIILDVVRRALRV